MKMSGYWWLPAGLVVVLGFLIWWNPVRRLLFPVPVYPYPTELKQHLQFINDDDLNLTPIGYYVYHPSSVASRGLIIYQHGNAADMGLMHPFLKQYSNAWGWSILSWEYPGYGPIRTDIPSESSINASLLRVINFVTKKLNIPLQEVVLFGQSIGSGPSVFAAKNLTQLAGLILQSPYTSILDVAAKFYGKTATEWVARIWNPWNSKENIKNVTAPILFLHGGSDPLIPPSHSQTLKNSSLQAKSTTLEIFSNVKHNWQTDTIIPTVKLFLNHINSIPSQTIHSNRFK